MTPSRAARVSRAPRRDRSVAGSGCHTLPPTARAACRSSPLPAPRLQLARPFPHTPALLCHTSTDEKSSSIKSEELKALDAALGGALSDIVSLYAFKGAAVRRAGLGLGGWWWHMRRQCAALALPAQKVHSLAEVMRLRLNNMRPACFTQCPCPFTLLLRAGQQPDCARRRHRPQVCHAGWPGQGRQGQGCSR